MKSVLGLVALLASFAAPCVFALDSTNVLGTVSFWYGGIDFAFMTTDDMRGVRIGLRRGVRPNVGDRVEATGLLSQTAPDIRLEDVTLRVIGHGDAPPALTCPGVAALYASPGDLSSSLNRPASMTVRVQDVNRRRSHVQLQVSDLGQSRPTTTATFPFPEDRALDPDLRRGAVLRVRCVPSASWTSRGVENLSLNIRGIYDIEVLSRPPWWTPGRIAMAVALTAFVLVILAAWVALLLRTRAAERENERIVARDRRRIADDLHDTIEQHLATAKLYLSAIHASGCVSANVSEAIRRVEDVLVHAKVEVRDAVMDLRGDKFAGVPLRDELKSLARQLSAVGAVTARTELSRLPDVVDPAIRRDVAAIVREAVTNAIKHGRPRNVTIVADLLDGGFTLRVLNDGEPFDAGRSLGPETGHYGINAMRARAARSGIALSFVNDGKWCGIRLEVGK